VFPYFFVSGTSTPHTVVSFSVWIGMTPRTKQRHKETATTVFTGLLINYPLQLFGLYICISLLGMSDPFWIGTALTFLITVVAYLRVYLIRKYYDGKR